MRGGEDGNATDMDFHVTGTNIIGSISGNMGSIYLQTNLKSIC